LIAERSIQLAYGLAIKTLNPAFLSYTVIDKTIGTERYILKVETKWYGTRWYINKALLNKICELLAVGAGVAGVLAALQAAGIITAPSAALTGLIAALVALGAAVLKAFDFCNGVYIIFPYGGLPPIVTPA